VFFASLGKAKQHKKIRLIWALCVYLNQIPHSILIDTPPKRIEAMSKTSVSVVLLIAILSSSIIAQDKSAEQMESITVNGVERQWRIFIPPSYKKDKAAPLVLDFHGSGSAPHKEAMLTEFEQLAVEEGFLVVSPAAKFPRKIDGRVTWNVDLHEDGVDDVRFIRELLTSISLQYMIDPSRIYATGMSGGARMSSRLACDLSNMIAAIGPVAGVRYPEDCSPSRPVPVITFHGKADNVNHYKHQANSSAYWRMGVEEALVGWVSKNQCTGSPTIEAVSDSVTRVSHQNCQSKGDVVFYRSDNAGHTWPGSPLADYLEKAGLGKTNTEIPATKLIWEFFKMHPLQ
jgi:polyhydroxybutyrate depolymerase